MRTEGNNPDTIDKTHSIIQRGSSLMVDNEEVAYKVFSLNMISKNHLPEKEEMLLLRISEVQPDPA